MKLLAVGLLMLRNNWGQERKLFWILELQDYCHLSQQTTEEEKVHSLEQFFVGGAVLRFQSCKLLFENIHFYLEILLAAP